MPAKTTNIVKNFSLSAPTTSPTLTISGSVTTVSYNVSIVAPLDTSATLSMQFQRSSDGGQTWNTFDDYEYNGGPVTRGVNAGQQATELIDGEIDNLNVGDMLQVTVPSVSGTWVVTASITQS